MAAASWDTSFDDGLMIFPDDEEQMLQALFESADWDSIDVISDEAHSDTLSDYDLASAHDFSAACASASDIPSNASIVGIDEEKDEKKKLEIEAQKAAPQLKSAKAATSATRPLQKGVKKVVRRQKTRGEPCLLKVCQFPVMISNALNAGDINGLEVAINRFFTSECQLIRSGSEMLFQGRDKIKSYLECFLEFMPDINCSVSSIKLKQSNSVVFKMRVEGTFINVETGAKESPQYRFNKVLMTEMRHKFTSYISQLQGAGFDAAYIEKVRKLEDDVVNKGRQCYCHFDYAGRLYFSEEAKAAWANSEKNPCETYAQSGDGAACGGVGVVSSFDVSCVIKSITMADLRL